MLVMEKTMRGNLTVKFKEEKNHGVLQAYMSDEADMRLIDLTLHHFNYCEEIAPKYEAMVAQLKERQRLIAGMNAGRDELVLITDLLAIAEPVKALKVGDVIPASEVPVGVIVEFTRPTRKYRRIDDNSDTTDTSPFECLCCEHTKNVFNYAKCTIVELPEVG